MNWRRGLVLAGINLAIVVPAFVSQENRFWRYTQTDISTRAAPRVEYVLFQEEMAISLDPCNWFDIGTSRLIEVGGFANLPTTFLTGWHEPCLIRTALGRTVRRAVGARNHTAEIVDCSFLSVLVFTQWVLVGGFPLLRPKRWWLEPGAFITSFALVGVALALVPAIDTLARIPAFIAGVGWLWWFGLLLWKPVHFAWQSTPNGFRRLSN